MSQIKPIVSYYNTLQLHQEYRDCLKSQQDHQVDLKQYDKIKDKSMDQYHIMAINGAYHLFCFGFCLIIIQEIHSARRAEELEMEREEREWRIQLQIIAEREHLIGAPLTHPLRP